MPARRTAFEIVTYIVLIIVPFLALWAASWNLNPEIIGLLLVLTGYTIVLVLPLKSFKIGPSGIEGELPVEGFRQEAISSVAHEVRQPVHIELSRPELEALETVKAERFPIVRFEIRQGDFKLPRVGFVLGNLTRSPLRGRINATVYLGNRKLGKVPPDPQGYYSGRTLWNINAGMAIFGNFAVHPECATTNEILRIQVEVTIIDSAGREYKLLPVCYRHVRESNSWFLEPTSIDNIIQGGQ
jgi:hypothetical protein